MRRIAIIAALLAIAALVVSAMAEADLRAILWTSRDDVYYHTDENCGGVASRYPISEEAALAFDKRPCPDCAAPEGEAAEAADDAAQAAAGDILATERAGTWVFRVSREALEAAMESGAQSGGRALGAGRLDSMLRLSVAGDEDAMEALVAVPTDGALLMNLRCMDGDCWLILRPSTGYSKENPLSWHAERLSMGLFESDDVRVTDVSPEAAFAPEAVDRDYRQVFSHSYSKVDLTVQRAMGANIAVIHWETDEADALTSTLRIGGDGDALPVFGYAGKKANVYCCVLTDAELGALVAGETPIMTPMSGIEGAAESKEEAAPFAPAATLTPDGDD